MLHWISLRSKGCHAPVLGVLILELDPGWGRVTEKGRGCFLLVSGFDLILFLLADSKTDRQPPRGCGSSPVGVGSYLVSVAGIPRIASLLGVCRRHSGRGAGRVPMHLPLLPVSLLAVQPVAPQDTC